MSDPGFYLVQRIKASPRAKTPPEERKGLARFRNPFGYGNLGDYDLDYMGGAAWIRENGGGEAPLLRAGGVRIQTLEGDMEAGLGTWVIRGVHGEFYPIQNEIFKETV